MKIEHVAMYVINLEMAKDFFLKYLDGVSNEGYYNETKGFRSYFISFEDGARLELINKPLLDDNKSNNNIGYAHIAFSLGSKEMRLCKPCTCFALFPCSCPSLFIFVFENVN